MTKRRSRMHSCTSASVRRYMPSSFLNPSFYAAWRGRSSEEMDQNSALGFQHKGAKTRRTGRIKQPSRHRMGESPRAPRKPSQMLSDRILFLVFLVSWCFYSGFRDLRLVRPLVSLNDSERTTAFEVAICDLKSETASLDLSIVSVLD
jgi:hypothetical protein